MTKRKAQRVATPRRKADADLETYWRPGRNAKSLISDIRPGVSAYPRSTIHGGTAVTEDKHRGHR